MTCVAKTPLGVTLQVDVYAFAMIAFELFEGRKPFGYMHPIEAARQASVDKLRPEFGALNRSVMA